MRKSLWIICLAMFLVFGLALMAGAATKVRVMWAEYDGLTPEYAANLEKAFEEKHPDIDLEIISTPWNDMHDRLITYIAGGNAPDLSVIGTRWLLELMDMGVVEPIEQHLSPELLDNIDPALFEGKIKGVVYGLPVAAGTRVMYWRSDLLDKVPETFEEMRTMLEKVAKPEENFYGIALTGQKYVELTEFAYFLFGNDGYFFDINEDGSYGKCIVNNEAGVGALTFMNNLVKDNLTQPGVTAYKRDEVQNLFISGNAAIMMTGGFGATLLTQQNVPFKWDVAPLPHFEGKPQSSLIVTDAMVMFNDSKAKAEASKFLDFFYSDEWRLEFDKLVGFPPVTKSLADNEFFQTPVYKYMVDQIAGAKPWPLMAEWPECNDLIWDNIEATFLGQKTPQQAMDDAAAAIDALRGL